MSGEAKCPACEGAWHDGGAYLTTCTGRPGCVRAVVRSERTTEPPAGVTVYCTDPPVPPSMINAPFRKSAAPDAAVGFVPPQTAVVTGWGPHTKIEPPPPAGGADIVERLRLEADGDHAIYGASNRPLILDAAAEIARLRAENERWRVIASENRDALAAMRNAINEAVPMQSEEADLKDGPELSVWCAAVAQSVIAEVTRLREYALRMADTANADMASRANDMWETAERVREAAAQIADPPLAHRKGAPGLWRQRRSQIAADIRGVDLHPLLGDPRCVPTQDRYLALADAVRRACISKVLNRLPQWEEAEAYAKAIDAIDLAPIVAAAMKEGE